MSCKRVMLPNRLTETPANSVGRIVEERKTDGTRPLAIMVLLSYPSDSIMIHKTVRDRAPAAEVAEGEGKGKGGKGRERYGGRGTRGILGKRLHLHFVFHAMCYVLVPQTSISLPSAARGVSAPRRIEF